MQSLEGLGSHAMPLGVGVGTFSLSRDHPLLSPRKWIVSVSAYFVLNISVMALHFVHFARTAASLRIPPWA